MSGTAGAVRGLVVDGFDEVLVEGVRDLDSRRPHTNGVILEEVQHPRSCLRVRFGGELVVTLLHFLDLLEGLLLWSQLSGTGRGCTRGYLQTTLDSRYDGDRSSSMLLGYWTIDYGKTASVLRYLPAYGLTLQYLSV